VVKTGQIIAKSSGFVSTNIHSSVSGKIKKVDLAPDSSGYRNKVFFIDVEVMNGWKKLTVNDLVKEFHLDGPQIVRKYTMQELFGLGGQLFPPM
jgi:electron transport complex protein RnfC